jgi:hypothetical protein
VGYLTTWVQGMVRMYAAAGRAEVRRCDHITAAFQFYPELAASGSDGHLSCMHPSGTCPNHCFLYTCACAPQGFLTAMKQEVNRKHAADKWALDDVVMTSEVTHPPKVSLQASAEGCSVGWPAQQCAPSGCMVLSLCG